jgi:hypothetical protein
MAAPNHVCGQTSKPRAGAAMTPAASATSQTAIPILPPSHILPVFPSIADRHGGPSEGRASPVENDFAILGVMFGIDRVDIS